MILDVMKGGRVRHEELPYDAEAFPRRVQKAVKLQRSIRPRLQRPVLPDISQVFDRAVAVHRVVFQFTCVGKCFLKVVKSVCSIGFL